MEKMELSVTPAENIKWQSHFGKQLSKETVVCMWKTTKQCKWKNCDAGNSDDSQKHHAEWNKPDNIYYKFLLIGLEQMKQSMVNIS